MASFTMEVSVDATRALLMLRRGERKMSYAIVNALNKTAKLVQAAERERVSREFHVRRPDFILRQAAIIKPFASVGAGRYEVTISVGNRRGLLLAGFESGAERFGQAALHKLGQEGVAVPITGTAARPSASAVVPEDLWVGKLKLGGSPRSKRAKAALVGAVLKGQQGTYLIPGVGIFLRQLGQRVSTLIDVFRSGVRLPRKLNFIQTGKAVAAREFPRLLSQQVREAFAHELGLENFLE